jgi:UDP-N-acetylmuramoylalanine--D-glutamate ligase
MIGIWGFGVVGKSVARFYAAQNYQLKVFDKKVLSDVDQQWMRDQAIYYDPTLSLESFLDQCDIIIPSPGIDLRPYKNYAHKFKQELDIFYACWRADNCTTPIIAITGTMGKTSVTHLLSECLKSTGKRVATGGNIGTALLDLVPLRFDVDYCVIELSSFQLEYAEHFAPDIALWTNLYPKHLDRHENMRNYLRAKFSIMAHQDETNIAIIPHSLQSMIHDAGLKTCAKILYWSECLLPADVEGYEVIDRTIVRKDAHGTELIKKSELPSITFFSNWILIIATLDTLGIDYKPLFSHHTFAIPEHRGECFAEVHGVKYFDDSKATLFEATLKAIERLEHMPLIVLIGGLSENNNRCSQIPLFKNKVKALVCFGAESEMLAAAAQNEQIPATSHQTLEEAVFYARSIAAQGDGILLSPGGPSYDLFANYHERAEKFRSLVLDGSSSAQVG